jgi:hypothetical protein
MIPLVKPVPLAGTAQACGTSIVSDDPFYRDRAGPILR